MKIETQTTNHSIKKMIEKKKNQMRKLNSVVTMFTATFKESKQ